jgi:hypothetical protein
MGNKSSRPETKRKEYNSPSVTQRYMEKLKNEAAANKALQDAIKTGENPRNTSPIFDDSSDDEEDEQTAVTTISKKGSIQSADPKYEEGNIRIGDNKLGGKRRKKTRKRRKKKKTKKRGGRRKTRKKRKTKRKRKRKRKR